MKTKNKFYSVLYLVLMGFAPCAESVLTVGHINGSVGFNNGAPTSPLVNTHSMKECFITGGNTNPPGFAADTKCSLFSTWTGPVPPIPGADYLMTVESHGGVTFDVSAQAFLSDAIGSGFFNFATQTVLVPEGSNVRLDFVECAGLINFKLGAVGSSCATPSFVDKLTLRTLPPARSADKSISQSISDTLFIVPNMNGTTYPLQYTLQNGTDPFHDLIQVIDQTPVTPQCNLETPVCIEFPSGGPGGGGSTSGLGEIRGQWDIVGEFEAARNRQLTLINGYNGPYNNSRLDSIFGNNSTQPSSTTIANPLWQLERLLPGSYKLGGVSLVRRDRAANVVVPESLGEPGRLPRVAVVANTITNLPGDPFVMTPGFFSGAILLQDTYTVSHPNAYSGLRYMGYNADSTAADGLPTYPLIGGYGLGSFVGAVANNGVSLTRTLSGDFNNDLCPDPVRTHIGCSQSAWPSKLKSSDPTVFGDMSAFDATLGMLKSNYELVIANANIQGNQTRSWQANRIQLIINTPPDTDDPSNPNSLPPIRHSVLNITERLAIPVPVGPGDHKTQDFKYCFGQVTAGRDFFKVTSGTLYEPKAQVVGEFQGTNFLNQNADYQVEGRFYGTPPNLASKDTSGSVILTLPEGMNYVITPTVRAVAPDGSESNTTFVKTTVNSLKCDQRVECALGLCVSVTLPNCAPANGLVNINGSVNSNGEDVSRIYYTVNGGLQVDICPSNCGADPTFSASVSVANGNNTILVYADSLNGTASTSSQIEMGTGQCAVLDCDADHDGDIDKLDLSLISKARGQVPLPSDPRDANLDGKIDLRDVKICIPLCTRTQCAAQ